jgi:hypothetical protein
MSRYSLYPGVFVCETCKGIATTMRHYVEEKKLTWVCKDKHLNTVSLETKKRKRDYERKI